MALANYNQGFGFNINVKTVRAVDPEYATKLNTMVDYYIIGAGITPNSAAYIQDSQMKQMALSLNNDNVNGNGKFTGAYSLAAIRSLYSLLNTYIKGPNQTYNITTFVAVNNPKYGSTVLMWNGQTMLWYLCQNQLYMDTAAAIQTKLRGRTSYKLV